MPTSILTPEAVTGLLAQSARVGNPAMSETFLVGVCILAMAAAVRAAAIACLAALRSVIPLLRTLVVVLIALVIVAVMESASGVVGEQPGTTVTAMQGLPSR